MKALSNNDIKEIAKALAVELKENLSPQSRWLTVEKTMSYTGIKSRTTILKKIKNGTFEAKKEDGRWIIDRVSIDHSFSSNYYFNEIL